jgi:Uma2 family endonuclease
MPVKEHMMADVQVQEMTLQDFMRRYAEEGPFEFVAGEIIPLSPQVSGSAMTAGRLLSAFYKFLAEHQLGEVVSEAPFVLTFDKSNWVKGSRVPDIMFFRAERFAEYTANNSDWEEKPFILVPDLVVEVGETTDGYSEVAEKVEGYLRDGVQVVWVVDRQRGTVTIWRKGEYVTLTENEKLMDENLLPGFELIIKNLFQ